MKATLVSVDEYLHSSYEPDCDYVDGELVERNVGERGHGVLQGHIYSYYLTRIRKSGVYPFIEQRVRISAQRYRVPDICLTSGDCTEAIFTTPPLAVIEVFSPEDRISRMQTRIDDYLSIAIRYIWIVDPQTRRAHTYTRGGSSEIEDGIPRTANPDTELPLNEIFNQIQAR